MKKVFSFATSWESKSQRKLQWLSLKLEKLTNALQSKITKHETIDETKSRQQIKSERRKKNNEKLERLRSSMTDENKHLNEANQESRASNWLTVLPLKDQGYDLNKEQFWMRCGYGTAGHYQERI